MRLSKEQFRELQLQWYDVLSNLGFQDIEEFKGNELVLKNHRSLNAYKNTDVFSKTLKEEYFLLMYQTVHNDETTFKNDLDRLVLNRHAEGAKIKDIVEELMKLGTPRNRLAVRFIIRKYAHAWGVRRYTRKQLGL